jgi:inorganic pyrophosphatase
MTLSSSHEWRIQKQMKQAFSMNGQPVVSSLKTALSKLRKANELKAIMETTSGRRSKFKFDPKLGIFKLHSTLPVGFVFPFDFGFIPLTLGGDGDPLDILILMDEPSFCGCLLECRLIGAITATQKNRSKQVRNDRFIGVSLESHEYKRLKNLNELSSTILNQVEFFFVGYNKMRGRKFQPLKRTGPIEARTLVERGFHEYDKQNTGRAL